MTRTPSSAASPYLVFGRPVHDEREVLAVSEVIRSGWWGTGPVTADFEAQFARHQNVAPDRCVAVNSGTAALHLALLAAGVRPGDEVITTALTFCATVHAILHAGATPVLVDVDPRTGCLSPEAVAAAVTSKTRAVVPVHLAGQLCQMNAIDDIARHHGLVVIEDCAHAVELLRPSVNGVARFCCYSFYTTKNVATVEGGMVVCPDETIAKRARMLSLHGMSTDAHARFSAGGYKHYDVAELGFKYNMTDLCAAIGRVQLCRMEEGARRRREIWRRYDDELASVPMLGPVVDESEAPHARHLYTRWLPPSSRIHRDEVLQQLHARGVGAGVHYRAVTEHRHLERRFGGVDRWPVARDIGRATLSLPLGAGYNDDEVSRVVEALHDVFDHA